MNLTVVGLLESAAKAESTAEFNRPIERQMEIGLLSSGLQEAAHRAECCMGWVWRQWLLGTPRAVISERIEPFVERGLELRRRCRSYDYLAVHDLFLLHCAIFASNEALLKAVAEGIADAAGDKDTKPLDRGRGELYAAAWCGLMKYLILGQREKAVDQSDLIWGAYRDNQVFAAPKPLAMPWLKRDWKAFAKAQKKDFEKLWNRARKDCWTVRAEISGRTIVTSERYQIGHQWCWAHCGMALLAHREGVEVVTDPFWFPASAITDPEVQDGRKPFNDPNQLEML